MLRFHRRRMNHPCCIVQNQGAAALLSPPGMKVESHVVTDRKLLKDVLLDKLFGVRRR